MANLTSVGITAGAPTSGTGTVSTIDQLLAQGVPISDGTATNAVAVKAASTAAATTDKALVVAISPNNTIPISAVSLPSHAVTNAGTFSVQNTAATPSGTNLIGKVQISDTTNLNTIKAASTASIATDTSMVVALSPNSPTPSGTNTIGKVQNLGNAGAIMDFAGQNATSPANSMLVGATFNTTPTTITSGNASPLQLDASGNLLVNIKAGAGSGGTALADEATFTEGTTSFTPVGGVFKTSQTALTTGQGGAVALTAAREMLTESKIWDGTNVAAVKAASTAPVTTDTSLVVSISPNSVNANGLATPANSAPVVVSDGYSNYETVAASQTAQTMGATGATGDYLSHVMVFPGTAACGVVTVLDNATTWGTFAGGGTTALPSLVPFMIPVGAFSTSGAWKITTGANVTAVGVGKFT